MNHNQQPEELGRDLSDFPSAIDEILLRLHDGDVNPFQWLAQDVDGEARVLNLGGNAALLATCLPDELIDADWSPTQCALTPRPDPSVDVIASSMAIMSMQPLDDVFAACRGVLVEGGQLRLLIASGRPLTAHDRIRYAKLMVAMRSRIKLPQSRVLQESPFFVEKFGFALVSDERRRFDYPVDQFDDADRLVDALYALGHKDERRDAIKAYAGSLKGSSIGVALRRLVFRATANPRI